MGKNAAQILSTKKKYMSNVEITVMALLALVNVGVISLHVKQSKLKSDIKQFVDEGIELANKAWEYKKLESQRKMSVDSMVLFAVDLSLRKEMCEYADNGDYARAAKIKEVLDLINNTINNYNSEIYK